MARVCVVCSDCYDVCINTQCWSHRTRWSIDIFFFNNSICEGSFNIRQLRLCGYPDWDLQSTQGPTLDLCCHMVFVFILYNSIDTCTCSLVYTDCNVVCIHSVAPAKQDEHRLPFFFFLTTVFSHLDFSKGKFRSFSLKRVSWCFEPSQEPAATESRYPTYGTCLVLYYSHNPSNPDMDYGIFKVCTDVNACNCTWECTDTLNRVCTESCLWEKKSFASPGNRTCVSGVPVRRSTKWATSPSSIHYDSCS